MPENTATNSARPRPRTHSGRATCAETFRFDNTVIQQAPATALAAKADYLVSEDRDLLDLGEHKGIKIISCSELLAILKESQGSYNSFPSFSPDSRLVALSRPDHSIRVYELPSGTKWKDLALGLPAQADDARAFAPSQRFDPTGPIRPSPA